MFGNQRNLSGFNPIAAMAALWTREKLTHPITLSFLREAAARADFADGKCSTGAWFAAR